IRDATVTGVQTCALPIYFLHSFGGATARVTPGQCQQSQCRSTLIDDYLLRPRMSVQGASLQGRPSGKSSHVRCDAESGSQFKFRSEERRVGKEGRTTYWR